MEQTLHTGGTYDFRRYDRVWQRVAPALEPYPAAQGTQAAVAVTTAANTAVPVAANAAAQIPATQPSDAPVPAGLPTAVPTPATQSSSTVISATQPTAAPVPTGLSAAAQVPASQPATALPAAMSAVTPSAALPGAEADPCCMGTEAADDLEVLAGFIEEELSEQRQLTALCRTAPLWAKQCLRDMAAASGSHARRLTAVYYLITGEPYRAAVSLDRVYVGRWCPALRERYHAMACGGLNYARAAEGTADPCLERLLEELSAEEFRHAGELLRLLERSVAG